MVNEIFPVDLPRCNNCDRAFKKAACEFPKFT